MADPNAGPKLHCISRPEISGIQEQNTFHYQLQVSLWGFGRDRHSQTMGGSGTNSPTVLDFCWQARVLKLPEEGSFILHYQRLGCFPTAVQEN